MKILFFYRFTEEYNFDHWLHMDFAEWLRVYSGAHVKCYGHRLHEVYPKFVAMPWDEKITMQDIHKEYPFDVVILNTKSRMFVRYLPPINPDNQPHSFSPTWLPSDFASYDCPKVMIEEDYHWETDDDWYYDNGIKLILQRHYSQSLRDGKVKKLWFPFSVDATVFSPNPNIPERDPRICKMGGYTYCYTHRMKVVQMLKPLNLIVDFSNTHREERYVKSLQNFAAFVSCSSTVNHTPAKIFEIMSSGGLLFTNRAPNDAYGLEKLFPKDTYVTYEEDYSDVIEKAKKIVHDRAYTREIAKRGMEYVQRHHNHRVRIGQLMNIIEKEFGIHI